MADERKCFAGDLGTDQIGRVIEVVLDDGGRMADELASVRHDLDGAGQKRTRVQFKHIPDYEIMTIFGKTKSGWSIAPESEVTVRR
jgi:hypothetical protein